MINIQLDRLDGDYHMVARNSEGAELHMDASPNIGGTGSGMRPMQVLLSSLAGCSTIDVISILKKQKQRIDSIHVEVQGGRDDKAVPSPFKKIHLNFQLTGEIEPSKLERAIQLSVEKYCSVLATLDKSIIVTYQGEVK